VTLISKLPHRPRSSARDYRRTLGELLFNAMLSERLDEISRKNAAPFLRAGAATSALTRSSDQFALFATAQEGLTLPAFSALLEEFARVERHGFTPGELERAKAQLTRRFENAAEERDKLDSRQFAAEISRHFLEQEAMPGLEADFRWFAGSCPRSRSRS
jgi:zinc protease